MPSNDNTHRSLDSYHLWGKKIVAIGRNYVEHAKELGNAVPSEVMFFIKPTSSYVTMPGNVEHPKGVDLHHEIELGVIISKSGRDIPVESAWDYVGGYCLAFDMTARDIQNAAKKAGTPWTVSKGFDTFTAIGSFLPKDMVPDPHNLRIWCSVDGKITQDGYTKDMIFKIPELLAHVSSIMALEEGDCILTGTPHGVGPVSAGQVLEAGLGTGESKDNLCTIRFPVAKRGGSGKFAWA